MDTKLKKTHKLTNFIITLCILLPAFLITALYPRISIAMKNAEEKEHEDIEAEGSHRPEWELDEKIINYAMEASYYIYGGLLQETTGEQVNDRALVQYGWNNDYNYMVKWFPYMATYTNGDRTAEAGNGNLDDEEVVGHLTLRFDAFGNLDEYITVEGRGANNIYVVYNDDYTLHSIAMKSVEQYESNVQVLEGELGVDIDENQLRPKNFEITFALREDGERNLVWLAAYPYAYMGMEQLLFEVGFIWIILVASVFVALMAFILPLFKRLNTGWEKLFCLPLEMIIALGFGAVWGFIGMFYAVGATCMWSDYPTLKILDVVVDKGVLYGCLLALNLCGWSGCFLLEYMVVTSFRQLLTKPIYYMKHHILIVYILRWIRRQCKKSWAKIRAIDFREKRNKIILSMIVIYFTIASVTCSIPFFIVWMWSGDGFFVVLWILIMLVLVLGSIGTFRFLKRKADEFHEQYNCILDAATEMANGNLTVSFEKELGIFVPIAVSLEKVQKGFEKAVIEEAKSQSMKTELITNVSHDLKTPLTAMITYIDLLKKEDITEEERQAYLDTLDRKSQRLKVLIEDLFEVSKAQSGNVQMNFMEVDIVSLLKQVKSEMEDLLEESNLTFRWNLPENKVLLSLDGQRTYRVFENLIQNALKYSMSYSRVYIEVIETKENVKVIFKNTSAQELNFDPQRLTERFVRGDASRKSEGSGLGLAIAKSFVELQNGNFEIDVDGDLFKVVLTWRK